MHGCRRGNNVFAWQIRLMLKSRAPVRAKYLNQKEGRGKMTVYKAFRNFYVFLISLSVLLGAMAGGFTAYKICCREPDAVYAVSKYGSNGTEVKELQKN